MKKSILNLGTALDKAEQKSIQGGRNPRIRMENQCYTDSDCCNHQHNDSFGYLCHSPGLGAPGVCVQGIFLQNPCS